MKIAVITDSYRLTSELWIWRQIEYLNSYIGYVGIMNGPDVDNENYPIINILKVPIKSTDISNSA
jgi:hypothetical protein